MKCMKKWFVVMALICAMLMGQVVCATETEGEVKVEDEAESEVKVEGEAEAEVAESEADSEAAASEDGMNNQPQTADEGTEEERQEEIEDSEIGENDKTEYALSEYASITLMHYDNAYEISTLISWPTDKLPDGLNYDAATNTLTLANYQNNEEILQIDNMGDDFKLNLTGENILRRVFCGQGDVQIVGKGSLNLCDDFSVSDNLSIQDCVINIDNSGLGIASGGSLSIRDCTINIWGESEYFTGIELLPWAGEREILIENAEVNIKNTASEESPFNNVGIDAQDGNLTIRDSNVRIELENGNMFGIAVGLMDQDGIVTGGRFTLSNSYIECSTKGEYFHTYFYEMNGLEKSCYFVGEESIDTLRDFGEIFEENEYRNNRYDSTQPYFLITPAYLRGDINEDGAADIKDCRIVLPYTLGKAELSNRQMLIADVNDDKEVDIQDLRKTLRYVCKKLEEL